MRIVVRLGYTVRLCLKRQNKYNSTRLKECESCVPQEHDCDSAWTNLLITVSEREASLCCCMVVSLLTSLVLALTNTGWYWQLCCRLHGVVTTIG